VTGAILIDPSAVLAILFDYEEDAYATGVVDHAARYGGVVPRLFWYEIKHVIIKGIRHNRTTRMRGDEQIYLLRGLIERTLVDPSDTAVLDTAERGQLSGYHAVYAALARQEGLALATLDRGLISAADVMGYALWQPNPGEAEGKE
jgi:predicted nucleic acid-binding protein